MTSIPGSVRVTGFIAPSDSADTYPTHDETYGAGGWRTVADLTARDALPAARRVEGMAVRVLDTGAGLPGFYTLSGGLTNDKWVEDAIGQGATEAADVGLPRLIDPATEVTTLADFWDIAASGVCLSGFALTDEGSGRISVALGHALLRSTNAPSGALTSCHVAALGMTTLTDENLNWVYADYASGTPAVAVSLSQPEGFSQVPLYCVVRWGSYLGIMDMRTGATNALWPGIDFPNLVNKTIGLVDRYRPLAALSGSPIGSAKIWTSSLNFVVESGIWAVGLRWYFQKFLDSSSDYFTAANIANPTGWTYVPMQDAVSAEHYDDGTGTLHDLTAGYYGVHWVYLLMLTPTPMLLVVYGQAEYETLAQALSAQEPINAVLPPACQFPGVSGLLGKIVVKQGETAIQAVHQPWDAYPPLPEGGGASSPYETSFADTGVTLADSTDFAIAEADPATIDGAGLMFSIDPSVSAGTATFTLYQDAARLEQVAEFLVDLADATTYRAAQAFGFSLEDAGTLYGTIAASGVAGGATVDIALVGLRVTPGEAPAALPAPYGDGIEDDGLGKPRVALASNSGLQFSGGKLKVDPDTAAAIYPVLGAGGMSVTGAVDDSTTQTVVAKKRFDAVGCTPLGASGPPTTGTYALGHEVVDADGVKWRCYGAGTPGDWVLADTVLTTCVDEITATIAQGAALSFDIETLGDCGTIQALQVWARRVTGTAEFQVPFRIKLYESYWFYAREMVWMGTGIARQTYVSVELPASQGWIDVHNNDVVEVDEAVVVWESNSRYELARCVARPTGQITIGEALVDGDHWDVNTLVCPVSEWTNVPYRNIDAISPTTGRRLCLSIVHDGIAGDPDLVFYVRAKVLNAGFVQS